MGGGSPEELGKKRLSRRGFVKVAGAAAAAASMAGCVPEALSLGPRRLTGPEPAPLTQSEYTATVCRICPAGCGVLARVVDGRVVKIEGNPAHPLNHGRICPRAQAAQQILYDPDRLQGPLRRVGDRGEGRWEPITWETAIDEIATRLSELLERDKADNLMFLHNASPGHMRELISRFSYAYGTPNVVLGDDWQAERLGHQLTQGWSDLAAYDWENTAYVLFFGGSFLEDWQPQVQMLRAYSYLRRGRPDRRARLVQIGPRFSVSAAKADEWVPVMPGRQAALALGLAHVIVAERLYDHDFVEDYTEGFDDLAAELLDGYGPDRVAGMTGVPSETIIRLAREFAGQRPAVAAIGRGLGEGTNELFCQVAVQLLNALVGSIDVPGGVLRPGRPPFTPWKSVPEIPDSARVDGAGGPDYPLAAGAYHAIPERIMAGPRIPEVLFMYEVNPFHDGAGGERRWRYALQYIPLVVSFSSFMDESTLYADLVLPNHTYLERWVDGTPPGGLEIPAVAVGQPVLPPLYDTRHTGDVLLALARAVGNTLADHLPWSDFAELLRFRAEGLFDAKGSIQAASRGEFWNELVSRGVWFGGPHVYGQWDQVLGTVSGRYNLRLDGLSLASEATGLEAQGAAVEIPLYEPPNYAGDENEYPLHLVPYRLVADAGCRAPNAPLLWELYGLHLKESWHSWVEINPETAGRMGIQDGDQVWLESEQGRARFRARLYEGAMPDVVSVPMGGGHTAGGRWATRVGGGNVTELVVPQVDRVAGTVAWCGTRVRLYKGGGEK